MKYPASLLFLVFSITLSAQHLQSERKLAASPKPVVNCFIDPNGKLVRIAWDSIGMRVRKGGTFGGFNYLAATDMIVFQSGKTIPLGPLERVSSIYGNTMLAIRFDSINTISTAVTYTIEGETIKQRASYNLPHDEIGAAQLTSAVIRVDDLSEGYGTYLDFFNSDFQLLNRVAPFDNGYSASYVTANESHVLAIYSDKPDNQWFMLLNASDGRTILSGRIPVNIENYFSVFLFDEQFVLAGYELIEAFDLSGKKIWTKAGNQIAGNDIFHDKNDLYIFTRTEVISINARTGKTNWKKQLEELHPVTSTVPNKRIRPVNFVVTPDGVGFVLATTSVGTLHPSGAKVDSRYIQFSKTGETKYNVVIPGKRKFVGVHSAAGQIRILTDEEIFLLEEK